MSEYVRGCHQDKHLRRQPAGMLVPLPVPEAAWDCVTAGLLLHKVQTVYPWVTALPTLWVRMQVVTPSQLMWQCPHSTAALKVPPPSIVYPGVGGAVTQG